MAPSIIFKYQSADSTAYLNQRLASLVTKGVYDGGTIAPVGGGSLSATRLPFLAIGKDGVTIADSESATVTYTASIANYHCILAKYNPYGVPSTPTVSELILTSGEYTAHADKAYLILLAVVTPTTEVTLSSIDYSARDSVGPFGHAWLKGTVATTSLLPLDTLTTLAGNKVGDMYLVQADWGVYVWTGSMWRLIAAMGAATLDGAYDDNNGTAIPGAGRVIYADAGAVEVIQSTGSQRQNDPTNAALRLNKSGSTTYGDGGLDLMVREGFDFSSILIRQAYQQGTDVQFNEPVDIILGNAILCTRGGCNWDDATRANVLLVEVAGSAVGNDGLYLADITGYNQAALRYLNGSPTSLIVEPSLQANFYTIRFSTGSATAGYHIPACADLGSGVSVGSVESWGNYGNTSSIGKLWYVEKDTLGYVLQVRRSDPAVSVSSTLVASIDQYGAGYFSSQDGPGTTGIGVTGASTATGGAGVRGNLYATGGAAVHGFTNGAGSVGVLGESGAGIGVFGIGNAVGVDGISYGGAGTMGVRGIQSGDPDGYGVFGYGTGGSIGVFGLCDTGSYPGVKGVGRDTGSCGVFGEHNPLSGEAGYGVVGWNNHVLSDGFTYPAVDGFAWGNAPGVRGQSVFGRGVVGVSGLTFEPGVFGTSLLGSGVYGEIPSAFAIAGVWGKGYSNKAGVLASSATTSGWVPRYSGVGPDLALQSDGQSWLRCGFYTDYNAAGFFPATPDYDGAMADATRADQRRYAAALIVRDPQQAEPKNAYTLDYWGRPARGNHLDDDFLYLNWSGHSTNVPPWYTNSADTGNGSYVVGAPTFLGGSCRLHAGSGGSSYAELATGTLWATHRSDSGGVIKGRLFARVMLTGTPSFFEIGFTDNPVRASATRWISMATGLAFTGYEDWWNGYYYGAGGTVSQAYVGTWSTWQNYNISLIIKDNTHAYCYINNWLADVITLPGSDVFSSTSQWCAYIYLQGTNVDAYCDQLQIWHDQANIWDCGYATPDF